MSITRQVLRTAFRKQYGSKMGNAWRNMRIMILGKLGYALELKRTSPRKKQFISF